MQVSKKEQEERAKIANLVLWLQMSVFAADETVNIRWFNRHKTKYALNNFTDTVLKEHGELIKSFWNIPDQIDMPEVCNILNRYAYLISNMNHAELQDVVQLIENHLKEKRNGHI